MYYRDNRRPGVAAEVIRRVPASASSNGSIGSGGDAVLGAVALGSMGLVLAWVVTGVDLLAIVALLIVLGYFGMAGTPRPSDAPVPAEGGPHSRGALPHAPATDARFHGLAAAGAIRGADSDAPRGVSSEPLPARMRRRSAYEGLAD